MSDVASESWSVEQGELRAVPMRLDKPINETTIALLANFNVGDHRYQVYVVYDPKDGVGRVRLNASTFRSVE